MKRVSVLSYGVFLLFMSLNVVSPGLLELNIKVGVFFYVWYDPKDSTSWRYPKIHDKPVLGHYNSCDPEVIKQHLKWISDAYIDFIVICWYGYTSYKFINDTAHQVFEVAKNVSTNVKLCIAVEPFNETEKGYDYAGIYNYVWNNFVKPYEPFYFHYQGKPLLLFYQGKYLVQNGNFPKNNTFTIEIFGHEEYCTWVYGYAEELRVDGPYPRNRQFSVMPRYDETSIPNRTRQHCIDPRLEYLYVEQWEEALKLASRGAIDIITITSWNEFPERTAIEPHYDSTAWNKNPYYLYDLTRTYICKLKGIDPQVQENTKDNLKLLTVLGTLCIAVILGLFLGRQKLRLKRRLLRTTPHSAA